MDNTGISQDGVSDESYHIALGIVGDQRSEITHLIIVVNAMYNELI
jgi:hypothetical protein